MGKNRSGEALSLQIGFLKKVESLNSENFKLGQGTRPFQIKNDGVGTVKLKVRLVHTDDFIETNFYPGWNPEIVSEIEKDESLNFYNLKAGD